MHSHFTRSAALRCQSIRLARSLRYGHSRRTMGSLSYATPTADFCGQDSQYHPTFNALIEWSHELSHASPESDFSSVAIEKAHQQANDSEAENIQVFSEELSYATAESDFSAQNVSSAHEVESEWSGNFSFASPESDFSALEVTTSSPINSEWSNRLSFASPENDFVSANVDLNLKEPEWSHMMSFATPSADFVSHSLDAQQHTAPPEDSFAPLPKSIEQAMEDRRAVVVTSNSPPFHVVDVNEAWEALCGYSREEAKNKEIGALLQGPETDSSEARSLIGRLAKEDYAETVLTNYSKGGRRFRNLLRVSTLPNHDGVPEYFVGVLHELEVDQRMNLSQS